MRTKVKQLFLKAKELQNQEVMIMGWVRTNRAQAQFGFLNVNDGTYFDNLQVVYDDKLNNFEEISKYRVGMSVKVVGKVVLTPEMKQPLEVHATSLEMLGDCPENYPIQPKRHTREFLRDVAHLRPRTNLFSAVFRIRSVAAMAIHKYFQDNGYLYVHTPLITCADCEGSDQMFKITTLNFNDLPLEEGKVDFSKDLFGKQAFITGSGQLHGETFAMAFSDIYTFGPTFRTENSNTKTHANEFWMIEPEMAFCDLDGLMDIEEEMLKFVVDYVLKECPLEIQFCDQFVAKGLKQKLIDLLQSKFVRISHHDVIDILKNAKVKWEFLPNYEDDIAKEHEKYITEYFNGPVFITNWPKDIKAYYMKLNPDGKTVAAVDLVVPQAGELMGGSQREENLEKLLARMKQLHIDQTEIEWYLDTRRFGGCIHSGFGMGFERLVMYLTGIENIRDVIPFPRTPKNCEF
ncbi:MAG: asparagine--tRNA ligase [Roseburia sp.]|nr:asparagine--tRNA ligase [Anaeroplasma bactoclasticum]MCM1196232.1 asparagine--tRNA ligase [Roseburia sp.]MCM1556054.1 asparagine--tRNA ligase [Anaeroplasma bactoclasticum]